jgi:hypothetical protein
LKTLLEKVKAEEIIDPSKTYFTCKLTMVDGTQIVRKVVPTGTFAQLFDYIETRSVDPDHVQSVPIPKEYLLLSDYPRTVYHRDQIIEKSGIHLNKNLGMLPLAFVFF